MELQDKYLSLLAKQYPDEQAVCTEIINLSAILNLPKGTEHFMSDLHGEAEAFTHLLNSCSGVIREKIDHLFSESMTEAERRAFATLVYYPREKLSLLKLAEQERRDWYQITLYRLVKLARQVASKYTRSAVRKRIPPAFAYVIDELLHTSGGEHNKEAYYRHIISTILSVGQADAFIEAICTLIKNLAVDRLHIVGDIFDRGPRADRILDLLIERQGRVDVQWGNHDILWMGAAAGSRACIAAVLNLALQYNTLDIVETGYGISLRSLIGFAGENYAGSDEFLPRADDGRTYVRGRMESLSRAHNAIAVILFKLEGQLAKRHPEYGFAERALLGRVDPVCGTVFVEGRERKLRHTDFPTVDFSDPFALSEAEECLMRELEESFRGSTRLQKHIRFLREAGSLYTVYNGNLLFHGCIPMEKDGSFTAVTLCGQTLYGRAYMDLCDREARRAMAGEADPDFLYFLFCGKNSPIYGREKMATFERYYLEDDGAILKEKKNPYFDLIEDPAVCDRILAAFGLDPARAHIINGHIPVRAKSGENPIGAGGKHLRIDGGFCKAYHKQTGTAGYTLIYNSHGLRLVCHSAFAGKDAVLREDYDVLSTSDVFETERARRLVRNTDAGRRITESIFDLKQLLDLYRS